MFDTEESQNGNSENVSSFSLDFFDSDELSKIELDKYHIESKVRYITHVSISLPEKWVWTKPCKTPVASLLAAEDMVCARFLRDFGFNPNHWTRFNGFTCEIRWEWPDLVMTSHAFIGETREVIVPEGMSPRKFRKEFHKVQFNPDSLQSEHIGSVTVTSNGYV